MRGTRAAALFVAVGAAALAVRLWMADQVATPWILIDELLYAGLAESLATEGRLAVRGESTTTSVLYPALIAPAWLVRDLDTTYQLAKAINVAAMSAVAVPVYLWARRLGGARAGLVAAGLTLLLPAFVYTGSLMTENLFLPLFVASAYALARALETPSRARWLVVLAALAAAVATRAQGLLLVPILVTAALVFAALEARAGGQPFARALRPLLGWAALPAAALLALWASLSLAGVTPAAYVRSVEIDYAPWELARWLAFNTGALVLASGVVPAVALVLLAGAARTTRLERAFVATAAAAVAWLLLLAGAASTWDPIGIRERYALHALPILLVGLVAWLARGAPRPRVPATLAAVGAVALLAALPLRTIFGSGSFLGDGFSLIPFWRLARVLPGDVDAARALLVAGAIGVALLFAFVPRRLAGTVFPALVAGFLAAASAAVFATARSQSLGVSLASGQAAEPGWIDAAVGRDSEVLFVNATPAEARDWVPVWQAEFWNRSFAGVLNVGATEPSPLPQRTAGGRAPPYALTAGPVEVEGELLAGAGGLRLYRVEPPLRIVGAG